MYPHVSTFLQAPSFTTNPHNHDTYSAYNKPEAVIDWLAHNDIEEEFVLILDADMIMRAPFLPEDLGAKQGTAISAYYGYLKVAVQSSFHLKVQRTLRLHVHAGAGGPGRKTRHCHLRLLYYLKATEAASWMLTLTSLAIKFHIFHRRRQSLQHNCEAPHP